MSPQAEWSSRADVSNSARVVVEEVIIGHYSPKQTSGRTAPRGGLDGAFDESVPAKAENKRAKGALLAGLRDGRVGKIVDKMEEKEALPSSGELEKLRLAARAGLSDARASGVLRKVLKARSAGSGDEASVVIEKAKDLLLVSLEDGGLDKAVSQVKHKLGTNSFEREDCIWTQGATDASAQNGGRALTSTNLAEMRGKGFRQREAAATTSRGAKDSTSRSGSKDSTSKKEAATPSRTRNAPRGKQPAARAPQAPAADKKRAKGALFAGLKDGRVAKIVDKMEENETARAEVDELERLRGRCRSGLASARISGSLTSALADAKTTFLQRPRGASSDEDEMLRLQGTAQQLLLTAVCTGQLNDVMEAVLGAAGGKDDEELTRLRVTAREGLAQAVSSGKLRSAIREARVAKERRQRAPRVDPLNIEAAIAPKLSPRTQGRPQPKRGQTLEVPKAAAAPPRGQAPSASQTPRGTIPQQPSQISPGLVASERLVLDAGPEPVQVYSLNVPLGHRHAHGQSSDSEDEDPSAVEQYVEGVVVDAAHQLGKRRRSWNLQGDAIAQDGQQFSSTMVPPMPPEPAAPPPKARDDAALRRPPGQVAAATSQIRIPPKPPPPADTSQRWSTQAMPGTPPSQSPKASAGRLQPPSELRRPKPSDSAEGQPTAPRSVAFSPRVHGEGTRLREVQPPSWASSEASRSRAQPSAPAAPPPPKPSPRRPPPRPAPSGPSSPGLNSGSTAAQAPPGMPPVPHVLRHRLAPAATELPEPRPSEVVEVAPPPGPPGKRAPRKVSSGEEPVSPAQDEVPIEPPVRPSMQATVATYSEMQPCAWEPVKKKKRVRGTGRKQPTGGTVANPDFHLPPVNQADRATVTGVCQAPKSRHDVAQLRKEQEDLYDWRARVATCALRFARTADCPAGSLQNFGAFTLD